MISIKTELKEKKYEVEQMLELIKEVSDLNNKIVKVSILKSAYILLLYNTIESTITMIFERVHEVLNSVSYIDLIPEVKNIWVDFFFKKNSEKKYREHLDQIINGDLKFPSFGGDFSNRIKPFSGNLDGRELDKLMKLYGIGSLNTPDRAKLLKIKDKRNKLAHGNEMFKESCRNMTIGELDTLQKATFEALDNIVDQVGVYISEKKYLLLP